jgi:pimeloyl-ACP methyl ester carboxylesterase
MSAWFVLRGLVREAGHWGGFLDRFEGAFPGVRAISLEIPGNGARFREKSPLTVGEMAETVRAEFLTRRTGDDHLFALSLGGMIGLEWMRRWPGDFRSAALVNTSVRGLSPLHLRLRAENYTSIFRMFLSGDSAFVEQKILEITSNRHKEFSSLAAEWVKITQVRPVASANALRQIVAAARYRPPQVKPPVPSLVLNGLGDRLVDPSCSRAIAQKWGLKPETHPTAGHDLTLDEPEWVLAKIRDFIAETGRLRG